jgi:hypothetical protein
MKVWAKSKYHCKLESFVTNVFVVERTRRSKNCSLLATHMGSWLSRPLTTPSIAHLTASALIHRRIEAVKHNSSRQDTQRQLTTLQRNPHLFDPLELVSKLYQLHILIGLRIQRLLRPKRYNHILDMAVPIHSAEPDLAVHRSADGDSRHRPAPKVPKQHVQRLERRAVVVDGELGRDDLDEGWGGRHGEEGAEGDDGRVGRRVYFYRGAGVVVDHVDAVELDAFVAADREADGGGGVVTAVVELCWEGLVWRVGTSG